MSDALEPLTPETGLGPRADVSTAAPPAKGGAAGSVNSVRAAVVAPLGVGRQSAFHAFARIDAEPGSILGRYASNHIHAVPGNYVSELRQVCYGSA